MTWKARFWIILAVVLAQLAAPWAEQERRTSPDNPDPYGHRVQRPNQLTSIAPTFGPWFWPHSCPDDYGNYDPGNCAIVTEP